MSLINRTPQVIHLRFPLGFPSTTGDSGPAMIWVALQMANADFDLQPLRLRKSDQAAEWYVVETRAVNAHFHWRMTPNGPIESSAFAVPALGPIRLTLGEIARNPDQLQDQFAIDQFTLTGGSVEVTLTSQINELQVLLRKLWPTRDHKDVVKFHCEPCGLHVEGRLPATFFAAPNATQPLSVAERTAILRLPRDDKDRFSLDGLDANARPYWTLSNHPFVRTSGPQATFPNASGHVRAWADAVGGFALAPGASNQRTLATFVDSVDSQPEQSCTVGLFRARGTTPATVAWFARRIGTRFNLGGGTAAEATYQPDRIEGSAPLVNSKQWSVAFNSPPAPMPPSAPQLSLTLTRPSSVACDVSTFLLPVVAPTAAFVPRPSAIGTPTNPAASHRFWLCLDSGWAALEAAAPRAEIDPERDTQGAIAGVLEIDRIFDQLESNRIPTGLSLRAKARQSGGVKLSLAGFAAQSANVLWRTDSLDLQLTDPFLTLATPPVFYQPALAPLAGTGDAVPTPLLPALTTGMPFDLEVTPNEGVVFSALPKVTDKVIRDTAPFVLRFDSAAGMAEGSRTLGIAVDGNNDFLVKFMRSVPPDADAIIAALEESLSKDRMQRAVFVSENVTKPIDAAKPQPLRVKLEGKPNITVKIPPNVVTIWQRPDSLPLVRSYPLDPEQDLGGFLDANRGLLPFRSVLPNTSSVEFHFSSLGLPTLGKNILTVQDIRGNIAVSSDWRLANAAGRGGSPAYFLPTLPGLEFDPSAAFANAANDPVWVFRHSVPVLDEAYATIAEARRDPTTAAQVEPRPPDPGDLPPGFDPTRVVDTEAFRFGPSAPTQASGWLPRTEGDNDARRGLLALQNLSAKLGGKSPLLELQLSNRDATASVAAAFSREKAVAGLDGIGLRIKTPTSAATDLPSFDIGLKPNGNAGNQEYDDAIANNGLPLLAAIVDGKVLTHDYLGLRHEEPLEAGSSRTRQIGDTTPCHRISERLDLLDSGGNQSLMQLDLLGIGIREAGNSGASSLRQTWLLHDGDGGMPKLGGFAFRPMQLAQFDLQGTDLFVSVVGTVELKEPTDKYVPDNSRSMLTPPGELSAEITWKNSGDGKWKLTAIKGGLDWRFLSSADSRRLEITRVKATFTGSAANGAWAMAVGAIELATITGALAIDLTTAATAFTANLEDGKLEVIDTITTKVSDLDVVIKPFLLDRNKFDRAELVKEGPVPDWADTDVSLQHELHWTRTVDTTRKWSLNFVADPNAPDGAWSLTVENTATGEFLVRSPLDAEVARPSCLLFHSPAIVNPGVVVAMPATSWFRRKLESIDQIVGGAVFQTPDTLASLSVHALLQLVPRQGLATLNGELAARLSLEAINGVARQQLTCTGWLRMKNQIVFLTPSDEVDHWATLLFRNTPWNFDSIFLGVGVTGVDSELNLLVEHSLVINNRMATWQVVQPVRLMKRRNFASNYLAAAANTDELVIDLSWAYWARVPEAPEKILAGRSVELESPFLDHQWQFRFRLEQRGEFDVRRAFVARLPFGYAGPINVTNQTITFGTNEAGNRGVLTSGAPAGDTVAALLPFVRRRTTFAALLEAAETPEFDRGGPNAQWLDSTFLAEFFGDADRTVRAGGTSQQTISPLLPAYPKSPTNSNPTQKLPAELPDWAWLLNALAMLPQQELQLTAAALRTPYLPRSTPKPLAGSSFVELPFRFEKAKVKMAEMGNRVHVQLLGILRNSLRVIRRVGIEPIDDGSATRLTAALRWGRDVLDETRRGDAAIVFRDFRISIPTPAPGLQTVDNVAIVPRSISSARSERPVWSDAPLAAAPSVNGAPPIAETDQRRRLPSHKLVNEDGTSSTITADNRPVVTVPIQGASIGVPEYFAFAARPELPPPEQPVRGIAATRIRLALSGPRPSGITAPSLLPARRAEAKVDGNFILQANGTDVGELFGWTKTEDVPFQVAQIAIPQTFPTPGASPHARRDAVLRKWNDGELTPVITVAPPLVDVVAWARRPGELTRSLIAGLRTGYPVLNSLKPYEDSPAIGQDLTLRRSRAKAGPFEQVSIELIRNHRLLGGLFQYSRFRLTQTLDATPLPEGGQVYFVLAGKSEIGVSATSIPEAELTPSLLRLNKDAVEPHRIFLVADEAFNPAIDFVGGSGDPMARTVLVIRLKNAELPEGNPFLNGSGERNPPTKEDPSKYVSVLDEEIVDPTPPGDKNHWVKLFEGGKSYHMDVFQALAALNPTKLRKVDRDLRALFKKAATNKDPIYIMLATYTRESDNPTKDWQAPGAPGAVIQIQLLDLQNDFEKPKSALTLLASSRSAQPSPPTDDEARDLKYRFGAFGRLGDNDFQPIRPIAFTPPVQDVGNGNGDENDITGPLVGWARTAELQSLDRLSGTAKSSGGDEETSDFDFDVVYYGPAGELIPTAISGT